MATIKRNFANCLGTGSKVQQVLHEEKSNHQETDYFSVHQITPAVYPQMRILCLLGKH